MEVVRMLHEGISLTVSGGKNQTHAIINRVIGERLAKAIVKRGMSRARVYCDVNETRPREYWDYENLVVTWGYVIS